jgi:hypothetical protein
MQNKTNKPRKGTAAQVKATPQREDLAVLLSKVLTHPALPAQLEAAIGEGMCELFNDLNGEQKRRLENNSAHIARLLAMTDENVKGGKR